MDSISIIKIANYLLATIEEDLYDETAKIFQKDLSNKIIEHNVKGVIIDISYLTILDTFTGKMLVNIAYTASLLGAETVVVGMQPAVAITLVELGMSLKNVYTALNVDKGVLLLDRLIKAL